MAKGSSFKCDDFGRHLVVSAGNETSSLINARVMALSVLHAQWVCAVEGTVGAVAGTVGAVASTVGAVASTVGAVASTVGAVASTVGAVAGTVGAVTSTESAMVSIVSAVTSTRPKLTKVIHTFKGWATDLLGKQGRYAININNVVYDPDSFNKNTYISFHTVLKIMKHLLTNISTCS